MVALTMIGSLMSCDGHLITPLTLQDLRMDTADKEDFDTEEDLKGKAILEAIQENKRQK